MNALYLRGMARSIPATDIIRFEADDNYTRVYVVGQPRPLLFGIAIGRLCGRFPFMERLSRSHAVNPDHVQPTRPGFVQVGELTIGVSATYAARLPNATLPGSTLAIPFH